MTIDLDRLRELAQEPDRVAMPRTSQFPSMTDQLLRQKQELDALRRGLREAIAELEQTADLRNATINLVGVVRDGGGDFPNFKIFGPLEDVVKALRRGGG